MLIFVSHNNNNTLTENKMGYTLYIEKNIIIKNKDLNLPTSIEETLNNDSSFIKIFNNIVVTNNDSSFTSISRIIMSFDGWDVSEVFEPYRNLNTNEIEEDDLRDFLRDVDSYNEEMFNTGGYEVFYTVSESY